jgi:hypothetical protein
VGNECLEQILDAICYDPLVRLPLLGRGIAALKLGREYPLRRHPSLMKGHASVGPDGVFAQLRAGTAGAVENDEHLAAFGRDLDAKAGATGIPVDHVGFWSR